MDLQTYTELMFNAASGGTDGNDASFEMAENMLDACDLEELRVSVSLLALALNGTVITLAMAVEKDPVFVLDYVWDTMRRGREAADE